MRSLERGLKAPLLFFFSWGLDKRRTYDIVISERLQPRYGCSVDKIVTRVKGGDYIKEIAKRENSECIVNLKEAR